jgi:hypothetical protein
MKKLFFLMIIVLSGFSSFSQSVTKNDYGRNILSFNPMHLITRDFVGVGIGYERMMNDYLGLKVPVMFAINNQYMNVGIEAKLYPTRNDGAVKYAIAPTFMFGIGNSQYEYNEWNGSTYVNRTVIEEANHIGFLLNHSLNVTITKQFHIGFDGGIGLNYFDQVAKNDLNRTNLSFLAQMHIGLGYRF